MPQDSISDLERSLAQAQRELSEALERQAASDEALRVISSSAGELDRVFQACNPHLSGRVRLYVAR